MNKYTFEMNVTGTAAAYVVAKDKEEAVHKIEMGDWRHVPDSQETDWNLPDCRDRASLICDIEPVSLSSGYQTGKFKASGSLCVGDLHFNFYDIEYFIEREDYQGYDNENMHIDDQFQMVSRIKLSEKFDKRIWGLEINSTEGL